MKKKKQHKPLILAGALALAIVTVLSATFAWFTASDSATNRLKTQDALANVSIQETFVPPDNWKPGQTVTKAVAVANTGTAPALARVSFNELMSVNALASGVSTPWNPASTTTAPLLTDVSQYTTANGWALYAGPTTANGNVTVTGAPSPATQVYVKYVSAAVSGNATDSWSFAVVAPITSGALAGSYQAVTYDTSWDSSTKTETISNLAYGTYNTTSQSPSTGVDWTVAKPAVSAIDFSQAEAQINTQNTPFKDNYKQNIMLNYNTAYLFNSTPTANDWYYNPSDGYFYFIGLVQPGTTTPDLLRSLTLDPNASADYYSNLDYTLNVNMQALQDTKAAIDAEWTTVAGNSSLQTALYALCES